MHWLGVALVLIASLDQGCSGQQQQGAEQITGQAAAEFVTCAPGSAQARCAGNACAQGCTSKPNAVCNINQCGDALFGGKPVDIPICGAYYVFNGALVEECTDFISEPVNVDNIICTGETVFCLVDPCQFSTCPEYPDAECLSSYCIGTYRDTPVGGCQAVFVDKQTGDRLYCGESSCVCPEVYQPVCCNGNDYSNICEAECAGEVACQKNTCEQGCFCTQQVAPVCCDGVEYGNECQADCALASNCKDGLCAAGLDAKLIGSWTLVKIQQSEGLLPFPGAKATIVFTNEGNSKGNVGGSNGCNGYGGGYVVPAAGKLEVGSLLQTLKACFGPQGKLEALYMPLIEGVDGFLVGPQRLTLLKGEKQVLVFKKD